MNKEFKYQILFSFYRDLLTEKQQQYLSLYYENNFSLVEISDIEGKTKEAIFDLIKRVNKKLDLYEKKLKLYEKSNIIEKTLRDNKVDEQIINKIIDIL